MRKSVHFTSKYPPHPALPPPESSRSVFTLVDGVTDRREGNKGEDGQKGEISDFKGFGGNLFSSVYEDAKHKQKGPTQEPIYLTLS